MRFGASGGGGEAAGAIAGAVAGVTSVIAAGVMNEDNPWVAYRRGRHRWSNAMVGLERCKRELEQARERRADQEAWLKNRDNWKAWKANAPSRKTGPGGCRAAHDPTSGQWPPWPTAECAYRDPALAVFHLAERMRLNNTVRAILYTRGGYDMEFPGRPNTGNISQWRRQARKHYDLLVGLEPYRVYFANAGVPLEPAPTHLFLRDSLMMMFPEEELQQDVSRGVLPFITRNNLLSTALTLLGAGLIPGTGRLPLWVYGFTLDEQRSMGPIGPTLDQVSRFIDTYTPGQIGKVTRFGATGRRVVSLGDSLKAWIQAGAPAVWQGQPVYRTEPAGGLQGLVAEADLDSGETPPLSTGAIAAITTAGVAGLAGLAWALSSLFGDR